MFGWFSPMRGYSYRIAGLAVGLATVGWMAGCGGGGSNNDPNTAFNGGIFSNGASRGRAAQPIAGANVAISVYTTGENLGSATSDANGSFSASIRTLPPGTVLLLVGTGSTAGGAVTVKGLIGMPSAGAVIRVDPETTIAANGLARVVTAGASKNVITADVAAQALNAVRAATAAGSVDLDTVDFRSQASVDAATTAAVGNVALVTSNTTARVFVDNVDTGKNAPHLEVALAAGAHTFRVQTSTQTSENSVNVPADGAAWVDLNLVSGGGSVPSSGTFGGSMTFNVNDETIASPASAVSIQQVDGFPNKRLVTISLHGVNGLPLDRAIHLQGTADATAGDKLSGSAGSASGSTIRADFVSGTSTVTQFQEIVESSTFNLTFNADGTVSFTLSANSALLSGSASGTLPGL